MPPSDEILDAFAAKYEVAGDQILFFGADRGTINGAKDMGFWFFHDDVSFDPDTGAFTGVHTAHVTTAGRATRPMTSRVTSCC